MANRNRDAGHAAEREEAKLYREMGYSSACCSRAESKNRDDQKVDLCYTGPWNVQVKRTARAPSYPTLLREMPNEEGQINMIVHTEVQKSAKGRFMPKGKYVILSAEDMYKIQKALIEHCPEFKLKS